MFENVFIPKYGIAYRIIIPTLLLLGSGPLLVVLFFGVREVSTVVNAVLALCVGIFGLINWITNRFIKIVFQEDRISFHRRFFRPLEYSYNSLTLLGSTQLQFGKQRVPLLWMENSDELVAKIKGLIESGVIPPVQIDGNTKTSEFLGLKAGALSIVPILLIGLFTEWFLLRYFGIIFDILLIFAVTSVVVVFITYALLKRSNKKKDLLVKNERGNL